MSITMSDIQSEHLFFTRHRLGAVRPYLYGGPDVADFIAYVFDAHVLEKQALDRSEYDGRHAFHVEFQISDSVVVLEVSDPPHESAAPGSIYVYVPNVDQVYARAMELKATSMMKPTDQAYDERSAGVRDSFGNRWWVSTYAAKAPMY